MATTGSGVAPVVSNITHVVALVCMCETVMSCVSGPGGSLAAALASAELTVSVAVGGAAGVASVRSPPNGTIALISGGGPI